MAETKKPMIYAGMLKRELTEVAERLGLRGVKKLRKAELIDAIQKALKRPASGAETKTAAKGAKSKPTRARRTAKAKEPRKAKARPAQRRATKEAPPAPREEAAPRPEPSGPMSAQTRVTATKYGARAAYPEEELRTVDTHLPGLPDGYGVDRLVLLPRDPAWLYAYWDLQQETKDRARRQGGQNLALRLYEELEGGLEPMAEHWCREIARSWYVPVPAPGRTYRAEVGYRTDRGQWIGLLRSNSIRVPPAAPSPVVADEFMTVRTDQELPRAEPGSPTRSRDAGDIGSAPRRGEQAGGVHRAAYEAALGLGETRQGGSSESVQVPTSPGARPGSWQHVSKDASDLARERGADEGFWLVADAELVVFGATEPDASVEIGGQTIKLRADGTFSVRMAFPEGQLEIPIVAAKADGDKQGRVTLRFERTSTDGEASAHG